MNIRGVNWGSKAGLLAASCTLAFGLAPRPQAQNRETPPPRSYEFSVKRGDHKTDVKVMMKDGRINAVSGIRSRDTFKFKRVKVGETPQITGRAEQTLKCAMLKPGDDLHWTLCFYVDKSAGTATVDTSGAEHVDTWDQVDGSFTSGPRPACWEDVRLQMSICDP